MPSARALAYRNHLPAPHDQEDDRGLPIDRVGIKGLAHPIEVRTGEGPNQSTVARVSLSVELPEHLKRTRMCHFISVLREHGPVIDGGTLPALAALLKQRLEARRAFVEVEFPYFIDKSAPISGTRGLVNYDVKLAASAGAGVAAPTLTVRVPVTTVCPISKAVSAYGAHSQRGYVTLTVRGSRLLTIKDAIDLVEASSSGEVFAALLRIDQKHLTERAYDHPVLVEDLVRNVAQRCLLQPHIDWFHVEAENIESTHNHSAYATIEGSTRPKPAKATRR
jgi:GTP cyclohydrolase I